MQLTSYFTISLGQASLASISSSMSTNIGKWQIAAHLQRGKVVLREAQIVGSDTLAVHGTTVHVRWSLTQHRAACVCDLFFIVYSLYSRYSLLISQNGKSAA